MSIHRGPALPSPRALAGARGFTIVELMVAMALGLVIVLVIAQVFVSSKQSYTTTEEMSRLQEDARYGLGQMSRVVRMAGYISNPLDAANLATIYPSTARAIDGAEGAAGANDTLTVRFQGSGATADGSVLDCVGNEIAAGNKAVNYYYIATGANGHSSLFCDNTGTVGPATTGPVELVPNVEAMQILYGVDTDGDYAANYYVTRDLVANPDQIVSARIGILFASNDFVASALDTSSHSVLDASTAAPNDRRLRRVYTTTVTLRNRTQ